MEIYPVHQRSNVVYPCAVFEYVRVERACFQDIQGWFHNKVFIGIIEIGEQPLMVCSKIQSKKKNR
jgi:hypothetical protein